MIPEGLTELLEKFTEKAISEKPINLVEFAANYFRNLLLESKSQPEEHRVGYIGARRHSVAAESFNPATITDLEPVVHPKSVAQKLRLVSVVKPIFIFRSLDEIQLRRVIDAIKETPVTKGQVIINQGEDGDYFYVIESGNYDIIINGNIVGSYAGSGSFGELALMYNTPRAATIIAKTDGVLWALDRTTFQHIVLRQAFLKRQLYENLLSSVPLLGSLSAYERTNLADALGSHTYEDGTWIIQEGERGEEMYFIEEGCVVISTKNSKGEEIVLKQLHKNDYFGELALILHEPRKASARAVGRTKLAVLDVSSFERLMGPCIEIMQREMGRYRTQLLETLGPDDIRNNPSLAKFVEFEQ
ncbi:unnamed protein product [Schistosoma spindalis]|nr:unnamed protein product [Schistosoma spindale]